MFWPMRFGLADVLTIDLRSEQTEGLLENECLTSGILN